MSREAIQEAIATNYDQVLNGGRAELLPNLVAGPYIQHNPKFPNGIAVIMDYIHSSGGVPCRVKRFAIDGDLAFVHVHYLNWAGKEYAGVDIFRFDAAGKIVEHWDVLQPIPPESANPNTMF